LHMSIRVLLHMSTAYLLVRLKLGVLLGTEQTHVKQFYATIGTAFVGQK
jgi:hypothetical protein